MIAYNTAWLHDLFMREEAEAAFHQDCLQSGEWDEINNKYPSRFYSPNFFIRIGLFILTTIIVLFSFGLFILFFGMSNEESIGTMTVFFGLLSYAALEYMVREKRHFRSGVDDALLWNAAGLVFGGLTILVDGGGLVNCIIVFIIALYGCLRFADRVLSIVMHVSLLGILFFACLKVGPYGRAFAPFVIMMFSGIIYLWAREGKGMSLNWLYSGCLKVIAVSALISFYFSCNYYVVRETNHLMFDPARSSADIPLGWLFWIFTVIIPIVYLIRGVLVKDIVLIRVGVILIAAAICTIRYYYSLAPVEVMMSVGGILLIIISYGLTRYLETPKFGFVSLETTPAGDTEKLQIESILIAQAFGTKPEIDGTTKFGGGGFGGGGATGDF